MLAFVSFVRGSCCRRDNIELLQDQVSLRRAHVRSHDELAESSVPQLTSKKYLIVRRIVRHVRYGVSTEIRRILNLRINPCKYLPSRDN